MRESQDFNDEPKQHSHISYKEYQKKVTKNPNEGTLIFVSTFFVLLLLFLGIAKQISPEVDVQIGDDSAISTEDISKSSVDDRLKLLQEEDSGNIKTEDDTFDSSLDEKVKLPDKLKKAEETPSEDVVTLSEKEATPKPAETASKPPKAEPTAAPAVTSKVVVGYYSSKEQAEVAKGIIAESGLNISPFVRSIGGAYTIQVGSYSTREKAQAVVNDLLKNNYPARILVEQ